NPFASPVDWATMVKTDISNTYWGWDPNLSATGGYITINTAGTVTLISPFSGSTGLNQFIQPGQGFFVKTTGASPVLTIREQDKVATFNANAFRTSSTAANDLPLIAINLTYTNSGGTVLADGTLAAFDPSFSPGIGEEDAVKIAGSGEGIAIMNSGELLSIDARPMPKDEEMILLNTTRLTKPLYTLQIFANEMQGVNVQAYLEDAYLNTTQPLSLNDTNLVTFNVSQAQSASFALNRFRIVFRKVSALPVRFLSLAAERQANGINLKWQVAEESGILTYDVERAANGIDFKKVASMSAVHGIGNGNGSYAWSDQKILEGDNNYRILAREKDGRKYYSKIVVVTKSRVKPEIKIYPNPVLNQKIQLMFIEMDRGEYQVSVHNTRGQQMLRLQVDHPGGTTKHPVPLVQNLPPGIYYLHVARKNYRYRLDLVIE
ncbi:MAG TPA: T9SS type A sorting domain-containing protein, partial [Chitinophagaceae bacterium]|nr:T9SS type A sorting domain-containing protein [Chitinophagaceae bacterium]